MWKGITLGDKVDSAVYFKKEVWSDDELFLADCFRFENKDGVLRAPIASTTKTAMFEFIKKSFYSQALSPDWEAWRKDMFPLISERYAIVTEATDIFLRKDINYQYFYEHQKETITTCLYKPYNLVALEQGLGKTLVAATLTKMLREKKTLVICPAVAKWQWYKEMTNKWGYDQLTFTILDSSKSRTIKGFLEKYIIINPDILSKHMEYILDAGLTHIVFDECFPYDTLITTDIGQLKIGDIVSKKIKCNALCYDSLNRVYLYRPIINWLKKP